MKNSEALKSVSSRHKRNVAKRATSSFSFLCLKNLAYVATFVVPARKIPEIYRNADESTFPGQGFWRIYNQVHDNKTIMKRDTVVEIYERLWRANGTGYFTIDPIFISILRKSKIVYFPVAAILCEMLQKSIHCIPRMR